MRTLIWGPYSVRYKGPVDCNSDIISAYLENYAAHPHRELPGVPLGKRNSSVFLQFSSHESNGRGIGKLRKRFWD